MLVIGAPSRLEHVRELGRGSGEFALQVGGGLAVPVSRSRAAAVREALVSRAVGARSHR